MDTLLTIGGLTPLSYAFYTVIQSVRQRGQITLLGTLLAAAATLIPISLIGWTVVSGVSEPILTIAALASAGIVLLFSLIITIRDARHSTPGLNHSYGLLGLGVAVLIIAGVLLVPRVLALVPGVTAEAAPDATMQVRPSFPSQLNNSDADTPDTANTPLSNSLPINPPEGFDLSALGGGETTLDPSTPENNGESFSAPAGFVLPGMDQNKIDTSAENERAAPTPVQPRLTYDDFAEQVLARIGTVAPDETAIASSETAPGDAAEAAGVEQQPAIAEQTCLLIVNYNLNLRVEASSSAERLLTIPFGSTLESSGHNDDNWWHVTYDGVAGWVSGDYLTPISACAALTATS